MTTFDKLKELIAENLGCEMEDIKGDTNLIEDLDADSLDIVELTMAIEEEFSIKIDDEEIAKVKTVDDILKQIEK